MGLAGLHVQIDHRSCGAQRSNMRMLAAGDTM
jgi:hypothetical protein